MAVAKKCDRCKDFYDPYYNGTNGVCTIERQPATNSMDIVRSYDLCPTCMRIFIKWISNEAEDFPKQM